MAYYSTVSQGDKFVPDSQLHNDLVNVANQFHGFSTPKERARLAVKEHDPHEDNVWIATVKEGNATTGFTCSLNNPTTGETRYNALVFLVQAFYGQEIPPGTQMIVHRTFVKVHDEIITKAD